MLLANFYDAVTIVRIYIVNFVHNLFKKLFAVATVSNYTCSLRNRGCIYGVEPFSQKLKSIYTYKCGLNVVLLLMILFSSQEVVEIHDL